METTIQKTKSTLMMSMVGMLTGFGLMPLMMKSMVMMSLNILVAKTSLIEDGDEAVGAKHISETHVAAKVLGCHDATKGIRRSVHIKAQSVRISLAWLCRLVWSNLQ